MRARRVFVLAGGATRSGGSAELGPFLNYGGVTQAGSEAQKKNQLSEKKEVLKVPHPADLQRED